MGNRCGREVGDRTIAHEYEQQVGENPEAYVCESHDDDGNE